MNKRIKVLSIVFLIMIIFTHFNYSYAYKNSAFEVSVSNKYMGKDVISNRECYGMGEGGNFLFLTEEDSSSNKIEKIKQDVLELIKLDIKLYGHSKMFYNLQKTEINGIIAFMYEANVDEVYYYIPTDNYIINVQILSLDESSPYNNTEFMQVINSIKILDTVNTINYDKDKITIINWDFLLKYIIPVFIIIAIVIGVIIIIKNKKK